MTDIYIHVGLARTATTWLQEELFLKLSEFIGIRIDYKNFQL